MKSWHERARLRGSGQPIIRPGPEWVGHEAWHVLLTDEGEQREMRWRPGLECWFDAKGTRLNAEDAAKQGLRYLAPARKAVST
jgi:hypothetical protein